MTFISLLRPLLSKSCEPWVSLCSLLGRSLVGAYNKMLTSHLLTTGFELNSMTYMERNLSARVGYAAAQTGNPRSLGTTGRPIASFLLNIPDNALRESSNQSTR